MKDIGSVQGNTEQAVPLVIGFDTVYVHTNIIPIPKDTQGNLVEGLFQYNEIQYDKDEYIKIMDEKNVNLENQLTDTQIALTEIFESMGV